MLDVLGEPYREADLAIDVAPAVGIALYPRHGAQASVLLQRAEVALFAALGSEEPVVGLRSRRRSASARNACR